MPLPQGGVRYFRKWLFDDNVVDDNFSLGMIRDVERWAIPPGGAYLLKDFLVDQPGKIYKRGGTSYQNSAVSPTSASGPIWVAVMTPDFTGDPRVVGIASNGSSGRYLYDLTTGVTPSALNIAVQPYENPSLYVGGSAGARMVVTDGQNAGAPKYIKLATGSLAIGTLGGSPPHGTVSCTHPPFFVLANDNSSHPNRIWFSPRTDLEDTWQKTGINASYVDIAEPVTAMASYGGALLVWTRKQLIRILGDAPPGDDNFNMFPQPISATGCIDARSVVKGSRGVYFANENGVYLTDGARVEEVTVGESGGISSYWRGIMSGFSPQLGFVVAAGLFLDKFLFVTVTRVGVSTEQLLCHLPNKAWTTMSGSLAADMYATSVSATADGNEIYLASPFDTDATHCRMVKASGIFAPSAYNGYDADGVTVVQPQLITRTYTLGTLHLKRFGYGHLTYLMNSSDSPQIAVEQAKGLEAQTGFSDVPEWNNMAATTTATSTIFRKRFRSFKRTQGLTFRFTQSNVQSTKTEIYGVEVEGAPFYMSEGTEEVGTADADAPDPDAPSRSWPESFYTGPSGETNVLPSSETGVFLGMQPGGTVSAARTRWAGWNTAASRTLDLYHFHYDGSVLANGDPYNATYGGVVGCEDPTDVAGAGVGSVTQEQYAINAGAIPMVAWFPNYTLPQVIAGTADAILTKVLNYWKTYGSTKIVWRPFSEFNLGPTYGIDLAAAYGGPYTAAQFRAAWQHVVNLAASLGVSNVVFVYNFDEGNNREYIVSCYPGNAYVDWVSPDSYNVSHVGDGTSSSPLLTGFAELDDLFNYTPSAGLATGATYCLGGAGVCRTWSNYSIFGSGIAPQNQIFCVGGTDMPADLPCVKPYFISETGCRYDNTSGATQVRKGQFWTNTLTRTFGPKTMTSMIGMSTFDADVHAVDNYDWRVDSDASAVNVTGSINAATTTAFTTMASDTYWKGR